MSKLLGNKTALITGIRGGIGRAILELFAENGANIYALLRSEDESFALYAAEIASKNNVFIKPVFADIRNEMEIKAAVSNIVKEKIPIDILVNSAGVISKHSSFMMTKIETMKEVFDVNFFGTIFLTQLISRYMIRNKSGVIINIASISGIDVDKSQLEYACSKAALIMATRKLADELFKNGIRVNAIAPGLTDTAMIKGLTEESLKYELGKTIMNRIMEPKEIAEVALFLASEKSSSMTGRTLRTDGGGG
ncbi:MAG: SDR family oxidoreductase, partial [Clostridiales Family XIII bacterium]|nr:SDR family oxidoreductase [Clostridiales Family XIII bacterium]